MTPCFVVASMENENWRMGLQACTGWVNNDDAKHAKKTNAAGISNAEGEFRHAQDENFSEKTSPCPILQG